MDKMNKTQNGGPLLDLPPKQGLYDPRFEKDACGVGFVAHIKGKKSHELVQQGLQILQNLDHRGAVGSEVNTGDGAGILIQMPHEFLMDECTKAGIKLPPEGEYGVAEQLSKSKNTSVAGMVEAGILESKRGKVRLLKPNELPDDWDPTTDKRLTSWETVHYLIRVLEAGGEGAAAKIVSKLGAKAEVARELCYRLYTLCERKKRATEALSYNGLVQSWPEITRLAREGESIDATVTESQTTMYEQE